MSTTTDAPKSRPAKALPWLRLYATAVDDDRLRLLAAEDRWYYTALLCCKRQGILGDDDGTPPSDLVCRRLAVKLGLAARDFGEAMRRLAEVELIHPETLQPLDWASQQQSSDVDSTAAERKRRQRERAAQAKPSDQGSVQEAGNGSQGSHEGVTRDSHGNVTGESRVTGGVTSRDVTRLEVDTEEEREPEEEIEHSSSGEPPKPPAPPPAEPAASSQTSGSTRGSRLSADWRLPKAWGQWALEQRPDWTADHVRLVAERFRDHWIAQPGKDGRKADWLATWRNWVRAERSTPASTGQQAGGQTSVDWAASWSGIVAKGAELGLTQGDAELAPAFKARVMSAAQLTDEERARLRADHGVAA